MLKRAVYLAMSAALLALPAVAHAQTKWGKIDELDALTDKKRRAVCATEEGYELCLTFAKDGVWYRFDTPGDLLGGQFPSIRVDRLAPWEGPPVGLKDYEKALPAGMQLQPRESHGTWMLWRGHGRSDMASEWAAIPPRPIAEMVQGKKMLVRAYMSNGKWRDVTYALGGFCEEAAKVYFEDGPPLVCRG